MTLTEIIEIAALYSEQDSGSLVSFYPSNLALFAVAIEQASRATPADHSKLQVWYGSMPESNGKTNYTAILHRGDLSEGFTIDRSEYPDRVRYEADRVRWLIGEIDKEPWILDYDSDKHSGYIAPADHIGDAAEKVDAGSVPVADAEIRELIVRLSHISKVSNFEGDRRTAADAARMLATLGDALAVLVAKPEAQSVRDAWISVDDRLPEQHEWVLVSDGTWSAIGMHLDDEDLEPNKRWMDESAELIESNGIKITHWQPLPAPPQKPVSDEVKP